MEAWNVPVRYTRKLRLNVLLAAYGWGKVDGREGRWGLPCRRNREKLLRLRDEALGCVSVVMTIAFYGEDVGVHWR